MEDTVTHNVKGNKVKLSLAEDAKYGKQGYRRLKSSARDRHIEFNIQSFEDLVVFWLKNKDECYWCGDSIKEYQALQDKILHMKTKNHLVLKLRRILNTHNGKFLTFDRLNSDEGYHVNNLVKSCLICNIAKGSILNEEEYRGIAVTVMNRIKNVVLIEWNKNDSR